MRRLVRIAAIAALIVTSQSSLFATGILTFEGFAELLPGKDRSGEID